MIEKQQPNTEELLIRVERLEQDKRQLQERLDQASRIVQLRDNALVDLKKLETELEAGRLHFIQLFEEAPLGYQSLDIEGHIVTVNQAWLDTLLYEKEAILGRWFGDLLEDSSKANFTLAFPQFKKKGGVSGIQFQMKRGDGSNIWVEFNGRIACDEQGHFLHTHCILSNITARKKAETLLNQQFEELEKKSEQIARARREWADAFDAINEPMFLHDKDGRVLRANRAYAERAGMTYGEMLNKPYWSVFPKQDGALPGCAEGLGSLPNGIGESPHYEEFEDGEGQCFSSQAYVIRDEKDNYLYSMHVMEDITERKQIEREREQHAQELRKALVDTIRTLATTVEKRDPYTAGHQQRVADLSVAIAQKMGLGDETVDGLRLGAIIHDIGKIYVPLEILNRPGRLTKTEFDLIKTHSEIGYDIMKEVRFPWPVAEMIRQHHERLDGSGYPQGLQGNEIILEARILQVADVVEAMSSHRPYRPGLGIEQALEEIDKNKGKTYDIQVADTCIELFHSGQFVFE